MPKQDTFCSSLSVVVPVTLMSGKLEKLGSWLKEISDLPIEVLLIHDKRDDATSLELQVLLKKLQNNKIVFKEGLYGSPGMARNAGLEFASNYWTCFWDSDDLPIVPIVNRLLSFKYEKEIDVIATNYILVNELTGAKKNMAIGKHLSTAIGMDPGLWRFYFKTESLLKHRFTDLHMAEDQLFIGKYLSFNHPIQIIDLPTYRYFRGNDDHLTKQKSALNDLCPATKECLREIQDGLERNVEVLSIMFIKLIISGLRYCEIKSKSMILVILIQGLFHRKSFVRTNIAIAIYRLIKERISF